MQPPDGIRPDTKNTPPEMNLLREFELEFYFLIN